MKKQLFYLGAFILSAILQSLQLVAQNTSPYWSLAGNSTATNTTSKLGTTNSINLRLFTNNIERVHINSSNGYVGLGTPAPSQRLHVVGNGYFTGNVGIGTTSLTYRLNVVSTTNHAIYGSTTASGKAGVYGNGGTYGVYGNSVNGYGVYGNSTYNFGVYGHSVNSYGGYFSSDNSDGLDAYTSNGYFGLYGYSGNSSGYGVYSNGGSYGTYGYSYAGQGVHGDSYNGLGGYFHSTNNWALEAVADNAYYAGVFYGAVWTSVGYSTSDRRVKKNIEDVGDALSIINKLQPKHYEFKNDDQYKALHLPTGMHYGLIAQDLEQVLPNLVHEEKVTLPVKTEAIKPKTPDGKDENQYDKIAAPAKMESIDVKAVNYIELIPILVKAMQEQQQQIGQLKDENSGLRKDVSDLRNEVQELKTFVTKNNITGGYSLDAASLDQNTPNPFNGTTIIRYHLPETAGSARVIITDMSGKTIKTISLTSGDNGQLTLNSGTFAAGSYNYTLWLDGKQVDSKKMVIAK